MVTGFKSEMSVADVTSLVTSRGVHSAVLPLVSLQCLEDSHHPARRQVEGTQQFVQLSERREACNQRQV